MMNSGKLVEICDRIMADPSIENIGFQLQRIAQVKAHAFEDGQWFQDIVTDIYHHVLKNDSLTGNDVRKIISRFQITDSMIEEEAPC